MSLLTLAPLHGCYECVRLESDGDLPRVVWSSYWRGVTFHEIRCVVPHSTTSPWMSIPRVYITRYTYVKRDTLAGMCDQPECREATYRAMLQAALDLVAERDARIAALERTSAAKTEEIRRYARAAVDGEPEI